MSIRAIIKLFETTEEEFAMVERQIPTPRWLGLLLFFFAFGAILWALTVSVDRTVVLYDEGIDGAKICTQVETPKGVTSCESFSQEDLDSFEWIPALSPR
jgi:hypothetical protein